MILIELFIIVLKTFLLFFFPVGKLQLNSSSVYFYINYITSDKNTISIPLSGFTAFVRRS